MRPQGEVRVALLNAAQALAETPVGGGTWRDLARHAQVGYAVARDTVKNMARSGDLEAAGAAQVPGSRRPMAIYKPKGRGGWVTSPLAIDGVMRSWSRG